MRKTRVKKLRESFEMQNPQLCTAPDYRKSKQYKTAWRLFKKVIMVKL